MTNANRSAARAWLDKEEVCRLDRGSPEHGQPMGQQTAAVCTEGAGGASQDQADPRSDDPRSGRLKSYHWAWLGVTPRVNASWLLDRLEDGFDMHHIDGDHSNDDPNNLVLIYHPDHIMIHCGKRPVGNFRNLVGVHPGPKRGTLIRGKVAYAYALRAEKSGERRVWINASDEVESVLNLPRGEGNAQSAAKVYALHHGLRWPLNLAAGNGRPALRTKSSKAADCD